MIRWEMTSLRLFSCGCVFTITTILFLISKYQNYYSNESDNLGLVLGQNTTGVERQLPKVAVVGVKKCGTGALLEILRMHPDVVVPSYGKTEILFWGQENLVKKGLSYYKVSRTESSLTKSART